MHSPDATPNPSYSGPRSRTSRLLAAATGAYSTVFVSIDTGPLAGPTNLRYAPEGTAIRVSWNPVEGADCYNIYHDEFFDSGCRLAGDGSPNLCEELAGNVVGKTYVHADPGSGKNYYWVVASNSGGCSDIDSENPPIALETSSTLPKNSATPTATQTPTPSNTPLPVSFPAIPTPHKGRQPK